MLRHYVLPMFITVLALFSLVTLKSIEPTLLTKQAGFFAAGGILFYLTSRITFWRWQKISSILYGALIFLLILTKIIGQATRGATRDRKSTRLNSSHQIISYAVFCLKKKKK